MVIHLLFLAVVVPVYYVAGVCLIVRACKGNRKGV